jgi:hypothetical protein
MPELSRRAALRGLLSGALAPVTAMNVCAQTGRGAAPPRPNARRISVQTPKEPDVEALWDVVAHKAFAFFWNETHPETGQTKDRARNLLSAPADTYTVASIASTGYMLASLCIGAERGWVSRREAEERALTSLRFLAETMPSKEGFYYHFTDWRTGERVWKSELSSIDTALLMQGALVAGQYFGGAARERADALFARVNWNWMQARAEGDPPDTLLKMGWRPETGFLDSRWSRYDEASYLYLLAMGAPKHALPPGVWERWKVETTTLEGFPVYAPLGPLFWAQMTPAYYDLRGMKDRLGRDWWQNFANTHRGHHAYCAARPDLYPRHSEPLWGITACDQPPAKPGEGKGYGAQDPVDGKNDGTVAPTAALAGVLFVPEIAARTLTDLFTHYRPRLWGRYGFSNAFNPKKDWYDEDVIGIDLGMMLLAIENHRSGLIWKRMTAHPVGKKGLRAAGFAPAPRM